MVLEQNEVKKGESGSRVHAHGWEIGCFPSQLRLHVLVAMQIMFEHNIFSVQNQSLMKVEETIHH